jgi:hypothetical protein
MHDPKTILATARLLVIAYAVVVTLVGWWAFKGRVPRSVRARYPERVAYTSQLPFTEKWRLAIGPEDLPLFVKARTRRNIFTGFLFVLVTYIPLAHGYLQLTAELLRCHMEAIK